MSLKESIGWTDKTCNPIKGKCKLGCWYCYYSGKRGIANRFKIDSMVTLNLQAFNKLPKTPKKVFLCSTHEIFGDWIPKAWRDEIFWKIEKNFPQHTFQILTKLPQNVDRPMPDNVHLGVSITKKAENYPRIKGLYKAKAKVKFISFEPLLEDVSGFRFQGYLGGKVDQMIIGRLTGYGRKYDPKREWIYNLVKYARGRNIPIFLKNNLKDIFAELLIQEFPRDEGEIR